MSGFEGVCSAVRAEEMAELKLLNEERKDMTQSGMEQAFEQVDAELADDDVLVVYLPDCHESRPDHLTGRVREACHRPPLYRTRVRTVKGSGRYHRERFTGYVSGVRRGICSRKFWRHQSGGRLFFRRKENIDESPPPPNEQSQLTKGGFHLKIWIDAQCRWNAYRKHSLVNELKGLEPFGQERKGLSLPRRISASEACVPSDGKQQWSAWR